MKFAEAEPLLLSGYGDATTKSTIPVHSKPKLGESLQRIVDLYDAQSNEVKVKEWRATEPSQIGALMMNADEHQINPFRRLM
jgi:hypothetical protein